MKKIIFVSSDSNKSGVPVHILHLIDGLKNNFEIEVIGPKGWLAEEVSKIKTVKYHAVDLLMKNITKVRNIYREAKPDIIHCHGVRAGLIGRVASSGIDTKIIYTEHNWTNDYELDQNWREPIQLFSLMLLNRNTDKIICVSNAVKNFYLENKLAAKQKLKVIHNGVNFFDKEDNSKSDIKKDEFKIGTMGSLVKRKNVHLIIKSVFILNRHGINTTLKILGVGEEEKNLRDMVSKLNLDSKVEFLLDKVSRDKLFADIDLYVQASRDESFGMAAVEAFGSGIPTIASNVGALPEILEGEYLFEKDSLESLETKILDTYKNYSKIFKEVRRTLPSFREKYSTETMCSNYLKLYNSILSKKTKSKSWLDVNIEAFKGWVKDITE